MDLFEKKAIVTGAGGGIGRAIAYVLAKRDTDVLICGRDKSKLEETIYNKPGAGKMVAYAGDILDENNIQEIILTAKQQLGGIDFLINNAGITQENAGFEELSAELFDEIMATNVRAPFLFCKYALPYLETSDCATIINICSAVAHKGYKYQSAYSASKHALLGFSKCIANELAPKDVRVHVISPGGVRTEMVKIARPDLDLDGLTLPEDVADLIEYLLTHRDSNGVVDEIKIRRPGKPAFD